jgi:hypothetical protein
MAILRIACMRLRAHPPGARPPMPINNFCVFSRETSFVDRKMKSASRQRPSRSAHYQTVSLRRKRGRACLRETATEEREAFGLRQMRVERQRLGDAWRSESKKPLGLRRERLKVILTCAVVMVSEERSGHT